MRFTWREGINQIINNKGAYSTNQKFIENVSQDLDKDNIAHIVYKNGENYILEIQ